MCRLWSDLGPITSRSDELVVINIPQHNKMFFSSTFIFWGVFLSFLSYHFLLLPRLSFISTCSASPPSLGSEDINFASNIPKLLVSFVVSLSIHFSTFHLFVYCLIIYFSFNILESFGHICLYLVFPEKWNRPCVCSWWVIQENIAPRPLGRPTQMKKNAVEQPGRRIVHILQLQPLN